MNITFNGVWRMDWGFGNPNLTAALLIGLFCVAWLPAFFFRRGFWLSLPAATAVGVCLVHTMSRGGILGGIVAMAVLAGFAPRPWPVKRLIGAATAFWIVIIATFFLNAHQRMGQGITTEDKSISHRLNIWKTAPQMLAAQPLGWGWNEAGRAYGDWFQPTERMESYGSLVNTHLTKVVELGIILGPIYLFLWFFVLYLSVPSRRSAWRAIPFALLLGFAVAATFTNMARHWPLWILPSAAVVAVMVDRIRLREKTSGVLLLGALLISFLVPGALFFVGKDRLTIPMRSENGAFVLGTGTPAIWVLADEGSLGQNYRRKLREYLSSKPDLTIGLCDHVGQLPKTMGAPVLVASPVDTAQAGSLLSRSPFLLFLKPNFSPSEIPRQGSFTAIFGEFSKSRLLSDWSGSPQLIKLEGIGDFIPNWPQTLLELARKENPDT